MAGTQAADSFLKWAASHTGEIHTDAINEAAMGFAAGWDAARSDLRKEILSAPPSARIRRMTAILGESE